MPLADARALIARAIAKADHLGVRGAVAVVGGSGVLVSASRMDRGGAGGMARARSKAWIAATQQLPSLVHAGLMRTLPVPMVTGFVAYSPEAVFPGAGGMPIAGPHGEVVAGIAASGATVGPFVDYPGADRRRLIADGRPANAEDLLVHYALGIPYEGQHGDDEERWLAAYGVNMATLLINLAPTEAAFNIPGLDRLIKPALWSHDVPVIQAMMLEGIVLIVVANFVADAVQAALDPRVRA